MFYTMVPTVCLAIGSAWLAETFIDHMINKVNDLNKMTKKSRNNPGKQKQMKNLFCALMQDFSEMKQLSIELIGCELILLMMLKSKIKTFSAFRLVNSINEIVEFSVTDTFIWTLVTLSSCLLALQIVLVVLYTYQRSVVFKFDSFTIIWPMLLHW